MFAYGTKCNEITSICYQLKSIVWESLKNIFKIVIANINTIGR